MYSSSDVDVEKAEGKKRSFLQAPRSYSKIPAPSSTSPRELPSEVGTPKTLPIPIPINSTPKYTVPEQIEAQEFFIGDRVIVGGIKPGTLLYFGTIHVTTGQWCGISLDEPEGIHDGLVSDVRYFTCRKGHGIFAPVEKVKHLDIKTTLNTVVKIIQAPSRISPIPSKSKVCQSDPLEQEFELREFDKCEQDTDEEIIGLDEDGILRDSEDEDDNDSSERNDTLKRVPRRILPKLPRSGSQGLSRVQCMKMEENGGRSELDEAAERLKMLSDEECVLVKGDEILDLPPSTGGSSGGEDSWSLSKDYLAMCDGNQKYLNITFDGDPESKASTQEASSQEPSEESPSPEFIFDQEMIEDGEFSTQPLEMSRDSSMGLLSSLVLEKTDLLYDLDSEVEDVYSDNLGSQDTLEPNSQEKMPTPDRQQNMNMSGEFDENDVESSTPYTDKSPPFKKGIDLNETYIQESSHETENVAFNTTFTQKEMGVIGNETFTQNAPGEIANETFTKNVQQNLNSTFCLEEKTEMPVHDVIVNLKNNDHNKREMVDSGISLRCSMSESATSMNSLRGSVTDSLSVRVLAQSCSADDNCNDNNSAYLVNGVLVKNGDMVQNVVEGSTNLVKREVIHTEMDDRQLISDLKDGHQKRQRPISYISTTSADTGYVPDTDSEVGTLTLNSPQEWMDKGFPGNHHHNHHEHGLDYHGRNSVGLEHSGERVPVLEPIPIESDSDFGTMTCDTDNETDRAEIVFPVQDCETKLTGVVMEEIHEGEQSEDEITQICDLPNTVTNTTITLEDNKTETMETEEDTPESNLDSTFTLPVSESTDTTNNSGNGDSCETTTESLSIVTVIIADNEVEEEKKNENQTDNNKKDIKEKSKTPKKKKFNVVKDFKKPNTKVVSKLSEYFKAPPPPKPVKEDKINTEEAKNKRNSIKGKIDFSKVTSKVDNKIIDNKVTAEDKNVVKDLKVKEIIEKEPVKKIKRTPPKSKWDNIMSQITDQKQPKPKIEVKSKLEAIIHAPSPVAKKEEEPAAPKPKKRISMGIPDYSKVQSKLSYAAAPRPTSTQKTDDAIPQISKSEIARKSREALKSKNLESKGSPQRSKNRSPARDSTDSLKGHLKEKLRRQSTPILKASLVETRSVDNSPNRSRNLSGKSDRQRNLSGESPRRPGIKDKMVHIDLADSLDGRGSRTGTGSVWSSRQSSVTDMSTTGVDDYSQDEKGLGRAMSEELVRRDSLNEETMSQTSVDMDTKVQKGEINQQRRKSSLIAPTNLLDYTLGDDETKIRGRPKIVKPVIRQHSAPSPVAGSRNKNKQTLNNVQVSTEKKSKRYRSRHQNRNKTKSKEKPKPPETVLAEDHHREVHRLEALCESRTKQLNVNKLQTQACEKAFDGMAVLVNHLAHNLDAFSCPSLKSKVSLLETNAITSKNRIEALEETKASLEAIIGRLKEEHKDYVNSLESEMQESKHRAIFELRKAHEEYTENRRVEHLSGMEKMKYQHRDDIQSLQRKQEFQMEELHKQHQDKLEEITGRFDGIKCTLSEKVDCLRSECDRLRDRARHCEEALQRDSDFKVQCALAPYKNLPQEIEGLKLVVEMRNEEINKLRSHNTDLQKKLEELPIAQEKIIALQQKKENLEAIISMKTDHEKTLHERCQNLMKKYDKESRANKRLSMEYEELMYKLTESFSETDEISDQEAAFYKKLGMSPTHEVPGSPGNGRRLRSTSSSDSSPTKSPHYRRPVSSILDNREDKKFRRRSGNFLMDEQRKNNSQRSTSPLAKQNPLTRSWSPTTQIISSPTPSSDNSKNRLSQSWCVDVFDDDLGNDSLQDAEDENQKADKVEDINNDTVSPRTTTNTPSSTNNRPSSDSVKGNEFHQGSKHTMDLHPVERSRNTETPTKPKDNITDVTSVVNKTTAPLDRQRTFEKESKLIDDRSTSSGDSAVLSTVPTMRCPPSKIPTNFTAEKRETKIPTRSHRESAV